MQNVKKQVLEFSSKSYFLVKVITYIISIRCCFRYLRGLFYPFFFGIWIRNFIHHTLRRTRVNIFTPFKCYVYIRTSVANIILFHLHSNTRCSYNTVSIKTAQNMRETNLSELSTSYFLINYHHVLTKHIRRWAKLIKYYDLLKNTHIYVNMRFLLLSLRYLKE